MSNRITLLVLPKKVQKLVEDDTLGTRKAEIIARLRQIEHVGARS